MMGIDCPGCNRMEMRRAPLRAVGGEGCGATVRPLVGDADLADGGADFEALKGCEWDFPTGIALMMFCQQLGGALFLSVGQNVFSNRLAKGLSGFAGFKPSSVVNIGATELRRYVSAEILPEVLEAYNTALVGVFRVALAMSSLGVLGAMGMEWKIVKKDKEKRKDAGDDGTEEKDLKKEVKDRKFI